MNEKYNHKDLGFNVEIAKKSLEKNREGWSKKKAERFKEVSFPDKRGLQMLIWKYPMTKIGSMYSMSDTYIKKIAKN